MTIESTDRKLTIRTPQKDFTLQKSDELNALGFIAVSGTKNWVLLQITVPVRRDDWALDLDNHLEEWSYVDGFTMDANDKGFETTS